MYGSLSKATPSARSHSNNILFKALLEELVRPTLVIPLTAIPRFVRFGPALAEPQEDTIGAKHGAVRAARVTYDDLTGMELEVRDAA